MDCGWKGLEGSRDDEVAEPIEDDVYIDTLCGLARQPVLEVLTDGVVLPQERLQVYAFLRGVYSLQHRSVEIATIAVELDGVFANADWRESRVGEALELTATR